MFLNFYPPPFPPSPTQNTKQKNIGWGDFFRGILSGKIFPDTLIITVVLVVAGVLVAVVVLAEVVMVVVAVILVVLVIVLVVVVTIKIMITISRNSDLSNNKNNNNSNDGAAADDDVRFLNINSYILFYFTKQRKLYKKPFSR